MFDLNRLKSIMKKMVDQKLIIIDEDQSFIMITLEEYEHLLESHELVKSINSPKEPVDHLMEIKAQPPSVELDLNQVNNELGLSTSDAQAVDDIRYESFQL